MNRPIQAFLWSVAAGLGLLSTGTWDHPKQAETARNEGSCQRTCTVPHSPLRVKINYDVYALLRCYVETVPGELTLLGTALADAGRNQIFLDQLLLPVQRSGASYTEVSEETLAQLLVEAVAQGVDTAQLKVWIHSHGQMEAFFSSTDERSMETAFPQADWVLSLVTNRAGELKARLSLYKPFRLDVDDVPVTVGLPSDLEAAIRQEVALKVQPGLANRGADSSLSAGQHQAGAPGRNGPSGLTSRESGQAMSRNSPVYVGDD